MQVMEESRTDERFRQVDRRFDRLEASIAALGAELRKEIRSSNSELRKEIKDSNAELRKEISRSTAELRAEIQAINTRVDTLQRTLLQVGGGLIGTTILAYSGLIATQI